MSDFLMSTYARLPIEFDHGEGACLWDTNGAKYLDGLSGIAVCGLGHAHPAFTKAVSKQVGQLIHTSNLYGIPLQEKLAGELTRISGMQRAFFCNSGAEANEAAIKLCRLYGHSKKITKPVILVMEGSFHGRTLATLSATGNPRIQAGFEPLVDGFFHVPYNDIKSLQQTAKNNVDICAVLVEAVLGEGGIVVPNKDYLPAIRELCDQQGWLMIVDEIQTGMGRTGKWFAYQHHDLVPDVITLAKGLGNGVPIGACLARGAAADVFQAGNHGSTFGGNPLAARAGLAVIHCLEEQNLVQRAAQVGKQMLQDLKQELRGTDGVIDIRGHGLMLGIELDRNCGILVKRALERGLLINVTADSVVRLLPPLIITDDQAREIVTGVCSVVQEFLSED